MSRTVKFYCGVILYSLFMCAITLPIWATVALICHKHLTLRAGTAELFYTLLTLLWLGNLFMYRPRTVRQRIVSWLFLFTVDLSRVALQRVSHPSIHHHQLLGSLDLVYDAVYTTIIVCIAEWVRRRNDKKAKAAARASATQA